MPHPPEHQAQEGQYQDSHLVTRYQRLIPPSGPGTWQVQHEYKGDWTPCKRYALGSQDLWLHLTHQQWVGASAPRPVGKGEGLPEDALSLHQPRGTASGIPGVARGAAAAGAPAEGDLTDRLIFDIDCKDEFGLRTRDERFRELLRLLNPTQAPLVSRTPSRLGLHVMFRIPAVNLDRLITGRTSGLLADVLRGAGLPVGPSQIELFPQATQILRLPLGRRMPLLDPETLEPYPDAAIGDAYVEDMLAGALARMEAWHSAPDDGLVERLEQLPRVPELRVVQAAQDDGSEDVGWVRRAAGIQPSAATLRLVHHGLSGPSSRYAAEFRVGIACLLAPTHFREYGLLDPRVDEQVADAIAGWLAARHNGWSKEWYLSRQGRRRDGGCAAAWAARYLTRSAAGDHMIDRVRRTVAGLDGSLRSTSLLAPAERLQLMAIAEDAYRQPGARRYRCEAWLLTFQRRLKEIIAYHSRRGTPLKQEIEGGHRVVSAEVCARWLQGYPGGDGRYTEYRQLLIDRGLMRLEEPSPMYKDRWAGERRALELAAPAHRYVVRVPDLSVQVRDVGVDRTALRAAAATLRVDGRPLTLDEGHHVLWLRARRVNLKARYGRSRAGLLDDIGAQLTRALGPEAIRMLAALEFVPLAA